MLVFFKDQLKNFIFLSLELHNSYLDNLSLEFVLSVNFEHNPKPWTQKHRRNTAFGRLLLCFNLTSSAGVTTVIICQGQKNLGLPKGCSLH